MSAARITPSGKRVLAEIIAYMVDSGGTPPTFREIGKRTGMKSTAVVSYHLRQLKAAGIITTGALYDVRAIRVIGATWTPPAELADLVAGGEGLEAA
jgi:SOS-response transcriptional repressor LexA